MFRPFILGFLFVLSLVACSEQAPYAPKPYGYHYIELPDTQYVTLPDTLPYTFRYSAHAKLFNDSSFLADRYWLEIYYPVYQANIDVSYKPIRQPKDLQKYVEECYKLAQKHNIKASGIGELVGKTPKGYTSVVYELEGDVPSYFQFYVTDSTKHFLRTSLYFPSSTHADSLAPIIEYIKKDMAVMMNTVDWNTTKTFDIKRKIFKKLGKNKLEFREE